ncbi:34007_t:CDS:2, partial [Gigaspora margarita]
MESNSNKENVQTVIPHIFLSHNMEQQNITTVNLVTLERSLPSNCNYVIDSFESIEAFNFLGAFSEPFEVKFRVNICTINDIEKWFDEFSDLHKTTMRETQGQIIKGVKYLFSKRFHCIHSHVVKLKQGLKGKTDDHTDAETEIMNIDPYPCIISMRFHHNHPFASSHATSFRSISNETKETFFRLFHAGHNPTSAYNTYLEEIQYENNEEILADRAVCPHKHNIYYLYQKYLDQFIGARNGKEMFSRLVDEVAEFNSNEKDCALIQPYIAPTDTNSGQPFILVI